MSESPSDSHATQYPLRLFLTGYMGAGKTTVGKILAQKLAYRFHDTDYLVMRGYRKSIAQVFRENGEASFRRAELLVLKELSGRNQIVVSTGGGTLAREDAFHIAKGAGTVIYLSAPINDLYERVIFSPKARPIVDVPESETVFKARFLDRQGFYEQAHCTVDTVNRRPEQVVEEILNFLNKEI